MFPDPRDDLEALRRHVAQSFCRPVVGLDHDSAVCG
jgi:hypothetical protein